MPLPRRWTLALAGLALASCASMTSSEYDNQARQKLAAGDKAGALESYSGAISAEKDPDSVRSYVKKRAELRESMGDGPGALKDYDLALAAAQSPEARMQTLMLRAQLKSRLKDSAGALADAGMALAAFEQVPPDFFRAVRGAEAHLARASIHQAQGRELDEMADYAAAAALVSLNARFQDNPGKKARDSLINAIARQEEQAEKAEAAQRPAALEALRSGRHQVQEKNYFEAIGPLSDAIKANPDYVEAYYWRSVAALGVKDYKLSLSDAENALRLSPYHPNHLYARSVAREMLGNLDGALTDIERTLLLTNSPSAYRAQRETVLEKLEQRDHPQAWALMQSGLKKHTDKNYTGALADYSAAIQLSPKYPDYYWRRAISQSWVEAPGRVERWRDDCIKAYNLDSRPRYWITKAEGDLALAGTFEYISLNLAGVYHDAAYAYQQAAELDAGQYDALMAKSRDAENRSRDTENRVRYPSSYTAQGQQAPAAPTTTTVNLLRDKGRSMFLHDFVVVFSCSSDKSRRRYEVTADDQGQATNLAREHINRGQWCGYNASFESANQVN